MLDTGAEQQEQYIRFLKSRQFCVCQQSRSVPESVGWLHAIGGGGGSRGHPVDESPTGRSARVVKRESELRGELETSEAVT